MNRPPRNQPGSRKDGQTGQAAGRHSGSARGRPRQFAESDAQSFIKRGFDALNRRDFKEAGACCQLVLKYMPRRVEAHFLIGLVGIESRDWATATRAFKNVVSLDEKHVAGWAQLARAFVTSGQYANAETALAHAVALDCDDPLVMDVIGTVHSLLGDQPAALKWCDKAAKASSSNIFELSRAKALTFLGRLEEADTALARVLEEKPASAQAHWMKSRLKKATSVEHIEIMREILANVPEVSEPASFLNYALGKEFEDLQMWDEAFDAYMRGAASRRAEVDFDEKAEQEMFEALATAFDSEWLAGAGGGNPNVSPIFIVGQPRTGTTLVERIITAHSDVTSAGELQQFAMSIKRLSGVVSPKPMTAAIIKKAVDINIGELGDMYLQTTRTIRGTTPRFVDKMPVNYLYVPLIAAALPNAKIIHVTRDPLDSCFSSFKQLFAEAYYHSYDLQEMARHHVRYRQLMARWQSLMGDRMLEVSYEKIVENTDINARKIIKYLDLQWQDACLDFHQQETSVTTASAAQVREKAHTRSVGLWRRFEMQLEPARSILVAANII